LFTSDWGLSEAEFPLIIGRELQGLPQQRADIILVPECWITDWDCHGESSAPVTAVNIGRPTAAHGLVRCVGIGGDADEVGCTSINVRQKRVR
jgi:hypothetical protein